ncbi:MAG: hypothetical protein K2G32_04595, partial [Oscillospiraceae bacterium]|nr:hypothetical protein [Oscillospiraceae bacterium]
MNKYEFKSAYDKITLSEDFKREAREKLLAMASGDRSAAATADDKYGDRAVAIKTTERVKSPARTIIGIVSAAAVLAVCVFGGGYLIKKHGSNIIEPPNSIVTERHWTDRDTAYEICHGDTEKPYSEEFAKELSEGAKAFHEKNLENLREQGMSAEIEEHPDDFRMSACVSYVFPSGDDYFAVKSYSFVQALDAGYFEIYFLKDGEAELIGEFDETYDTLISDGEYLYYLLDDDLCRISPEGATENILNLTEYDPENPDDKMEILP